MMLKKRGKVHWKFENEPLAGYEVPAIGSKILNLICGKNKYSFNN